jgi:hypothetical protein
MMFLLERFLGHVVPPVCGHLRRATPLADVRWVLPKSLQSTLRRSRHFAEKIDRFCPQSRLLLRP